MLSETFRPNTFDEIIGHSEAKEILEKYLKSNTPGKAVLITGSPGIGKTTLVIASAKTCEYEPLEVNASRHMRSYEDVQKLRDSCMSIVSFTSFIKYETPRKTCVILDEVDGSDPHAQRKILEWIRDETRKVPILMTSNEVPVIFKKSPQNVEIHRCMPLNTKTLYENLKKHSSMSFSEFQALVKECQFDVRRIINRLQYGKSDSIKSVPLTGDIVKDLFTHQEMFYGKSPTYWDL
ncbi:AAA family ATPase [bacterium]|nr:AAA family ATPase [Actinomycetota bacterium]NDG29393.1 AAA family ATPase [bacterium]